MSSRRRKSPIERWAGFPVDMITNCSPEFRLAGRLWLVGENPKGAELAVDLYRVSWLFALALLLLLFNSMTRPLQDVAMALAAFRIIEIMFSNLRLYLLPRPGEGAPILRFGRSVTVATLQVSLMVLAFAILYLGEGGVVDHGTALETPMEAAYFSTVTITTLGFGDFLPVSGISRALVIVQLIGGILIVMGFMPLVNAQIALHERTGASRQAKAADGGLLQPPRSLDGAEVVHWAWSGNQAFFDVPSGLGALPVHGLAVCEDVDSGRVFRFACNANWEVLNDSPFRTVEDALSGASSEFDVHAIQWREWGPVS